MLKINYLFPAKELVISAAQINLVMTATQIEERDLTNDAFTSQ